MLIKEYRIPLPLSVAEYKIAQLYMIAKKSREESKGTGSGVEILVNEPYFDGPGGDGQYTRKVYHVGSHLPGWLKSLVPKSALTVEEEAWNAYPYTKTRFSCPFIERFSVEIETKYLDDAGDKENVFDLSTSELRNRVVDLIDVVRDQLPVGDYAKDEDPTLYVSKKTGRGPLTENWIDEIQDRRRHGKAATVMCAYKLTRVEFRYWGMQTKIEKFVHDVALRKTMLRAHRQAWAWQDEWHGLTMDEIRQIERETQEALAKKMAAAAEGEEMGEDSALGTEGATVNLEMIDRDREVTIVEPPLTRSGGNNARNRSRSPSPCRSRADTAGSANDPRRKRSWRGGSGQLGSPPSASGTNLAELQLTEWRMESICRRDSDEDSSEEFFDAEDEGGDAPGISKWSSVEMVTAYEDESIFAPSHIRKTQTERARPSSVGPQQSVDTSLPASPTGSPTHHQPPCPTSVLILVLHAGNVLDPGVDTLANKKSDLTTFTGGMESAIRQHYSGMQGHVVIRLVPCPPICADALAVLSNLTPFSFQASPSAIDGVPYNQEPLPIAALPLFAVASPDYSDYLSRTIALTNRIYQEFLKSEEGSGFTGQVVLIGDSLGSILAFDALCRYGGVGGVSCCAPHAAEGGSSSRYGSENSINVEGDNTPVPQKGATTPGQSPNPQISISDGSNAESAERKKKSKDLSDPLDTTASLFDAVAVQRLLHAPSLRRCSSSSSSAGGGGTQGGTGSPKQNVLFDFETSDFFMFGSPLALILTFRKMISNEEKIAPLAKPQCHQVYNLFHPTDSLSLRLEPLLSARFAQLPPVNIPRYQKYPLGDGQPIHLLEYLQSHSHVFMEGATGGAVIHSAQQQASNRRTSEASITSLASGVSETQLPLSALTTLTSKWWGNKRVDYALYCPEGLANFPSNALPHLFHSSYWESSDVIAFILRQVIRCDNLVLQSESDAETSASTFVPGQPREKWIRKRTSVKIKNVTANHRANDVIVKEGDAQVITARFMYGPFDMVALTGEKVDIHVMRDTRTGEWQHLSTETTDKGGRVSYTIPKDKALGYGMFPVKMVVRGDHTSVDFFLCVVPPKTECVVFSIDGSFTASMSVTGRDPKVRAGAVDVVRHWQELGYLILYITGRPDMQQRRVVSWLAQHNFPHGLVYFAEGLSTGPLKHKTDYLKQLQIEAELVYHAAYGSAKDIAVYAALDILPSHIFIVGKASKRQHAHATILSEGYASHLADLKTPGASRPAQGNARMVLTRGCFGLPGSNAGLRRRRSAKRTTSYPMSPPPTGRGASPKQKTHPTSGIS